MYENSVLYRNKEGAVYLYLDIVMNPGGKNQRKRNYIREISSWIIRKNMYILISDTQQ